ncbi:phosphoribosylformylglycinamidine cyclo-ligase [Serpentinicella sp. ANB-PHB4]|uniref:phosphoribosylformylglycinamidine cyclo-ligase n=1 Tax=Serpentinicella sp. ANB-PHB4 TaxID=3074076 RepID=UPI00285C6CB8|nr:phosphoribosylformylglycinamidine cyclo-ligase [Serpentinicella sp. ANB-PHB4]MDR5658594.1 phosphoribosylformylglycinamidine cyclo-ligase [Serpentinicella sp. ANB-PHB4]
MGENITYKSAGVDVEEGQKAVQLMKHHVKSTFNKNVLDDIGGFGGLFSLDLEGIKEPVLVSGTDGVGTKLKLAFMMDKHDTIGQDCVAMCVNDILCQGAKPLFFLDYVATGQLKAEKVADIVKGVALGCRKSGCALIGGETAEMPSFYADGEYDMAGFTVGIVDKSKVITGQNIKPGNKIIGLSSSGIHSNGYSLVRKLFFDVANMGLEDWVDELGKTLGEALIEPTKIYVKPVLEALKSINIDGIVHITGGGFFENIPRVLPDNVDAKIDLGTWDMPPIFNLIQNKGNVELEEMYKTFNMGIGMMLIVDADDVDGTLEILKSEGEQGYIIGEIIEGKRQVKLCQA